MEKESGSATMDGRDLLSFTLLSMAISCFSSTRVTPVLKLSYSTPLLLRLSTQF
ncbi:hypothetical protein LINPERPRIM_LOCUS7427 [Linum perenne]